MLLVDSFGSRLLTQDVVLKLCDFGTATVLTDQRPRCVAPWCGSVVSALGSGGAKPGRSLVNIGTLSYTAPEVEGTCLFSISPNDSFFGI